MNILVTGGAGYIGSHLVKRLLNDNHKVVVIDNLVTGNKESIDKKAIFLEENFGNRILISNILKKYNIEVVMHLAAYSLVKESITKPSKYYLNNFVNSRILLDEIRQSKVKKFIFSSSAAVYGNPATIPIIEDHPTKPINPYGKTKLLFEKDLEYFGGRDGLKCVSLRYFNAAGAGYNIGEDHDSETHLIPIILKTALGQRDKLQVFGNDYPTPDGTCIRDFVHVEDIAQAHVLAIGKEGIFNIGSEHGYSVKKIIELCKKITGKDFKVKITKRREGDPPVLVASNQKIIRELGWKPQHDIEDIIKSAWEWHKTHPKGFKK